MQSEKCAESASVGSSPGCEAKKVKRIVKLIVIDDPDYPCRDDIIEQCLKGFDIRYLDWNKDDIYVPSLKLVAKNLHELWASWSGSGTTLLGWSGLHGLPSLGTLRKVHIMVGDGLESPARTKEYLESFKKNLPQYSISIPSDTNIQDGLPASGASSAVPKEVTNRWLAAVERFISRVSNQFSQEIRQKMNPITVAVIGDGADADKIASTKPLEGWCAIKVPPTHKDVRMWYYSASGHGTTMVNLIRTICPFASFFIGKLDTDNIVYDSAAKSAALAIKDAVNKGANIISMSWTIYEEENHNNKDAIRELNNELVDAAKANKILYCAGEDQGQFEQTQGKRQPYPASCTTAVIKKIGSATQHGTETAETNIQNVDYLFPGDLPEHPFAPNIRSSSCATARAAGLAALILWCAEVCRVQLGDKANEENSRLEDEDVKKTRLEQEKTRKTAAGSKRSSGAKDTKDAARIKAQEKLKGAKDSEEWEDTDAETQLNYFDFQNDFRMNTLFNNLKMNQTHKVGSLVDITDLLDNAAKHQTDCAGALIKLCNNILWRSN